ncbi:MAG: HU family DNA-binding protein [Prevotellaceae bacterium]|nr:HU family DNA-binding protein [Prevotellaceae bacterium]
MKLSAQHIIAALVEGGMKKAQATEFTKAVFELIVEGLEKDGRVKINGLGTFKVVEVESRESLNVKSMQHLVIPKHSKVKFITCKELQSSVNKKYENLEVEMLDPIEKTWIEKLRNKIFK